MARPMRPEIEAPTLKAYGCPTAGEIALFDVREHGQYGSGHLFLAVPLPYSRFEIALLALAPERRGAGGSLR